MLEQKLATLQRLLANTQEASESSWQVGTTLPAPRQGLQRVGRTSNRAILHSSEHFLSGSHCQYLSQLPDRKAKEETTIDLKQISL